MQMGFWSRWVFDSRSGADDEDGICRIWRRAVDSVGERRADERLALKTGGRCSPDSVEQGQQKKIWANGKNEARSTWCDDAVHGGDDSGTGSADGDGRIC
ncbi:hypothetical protein ACLOJK_002120 [Asimina triloba]